MSTPQAPTPDNEPDGTTPPWAESPPQPQYQQPYPPQYAPPQYDPTQYQTAQQPSPQYPNAPQYPKARYQADQYAQQYPAAQYGQYPPYAQTAAKPRQLWILWVALAAVLVLVIIAAAAAFQISRSFGGAPAVAPPVEPTSMSVAETQTYIETDDYLSDMYDRYEAMSDDEMAALFPGGALGYDSSYVTDFFFLLNGQLEDLYFYADFTAYDEHEYDTDILDIRDAADEIEREFLAQENFSEYVFGTLEDGTEYESDGRYFPEGTPALNAEREAFAQNFAPYLDGNGSYQAAGEELVAALGMKLSYNFDEMYVACPADGFTISDPRSVGAAYCPGVRDTIYVNSNGYNYPNILYDLYYIDLLKHEFAHVRTTGTCGTSQPGVTLTGSAHFEATASSYAMMFLGADGGRLAAAAGDFPEYTMTDATNQAAQSIHDGNCG